MKKSILILVLAVCTLLTLTACAGHSHDFSDEWVSDETHHRKVCTVDGCNEAAEKAEHSFESGMLEGEKVVYTCSVCGKEVEREVTTRVSEDEWNAFVSLEGIDSFTLTATSESGGAFSRVVEKRDGGLLYHGSSEKAADIYVLDTEKTAMEFTMNSLLEYLRGRYSDYAYDPETGFYSAVIEIEGTDIAVKCGFADGMLNFMEISRSVGGKTERTTASFGDYGTTEIAPPTEAVSEAYTAATRSSLFNNVTIKGSLGGKTCNLKINKDPNNETLGAILEELRSFELENLVGFIFLNGELVNLVGLDGDAIYDISLDSGKITSYGVGAENTHLTFSDYGTTVGVGSDVGDVAPELVLSLIDGGSLSLSELRGRVVVLNFWGTWCGPCKSELPEFDRIASDYSGSVSVVAVHSVEGISNAKAYTDTNYPDSSIVFAMDEESGVKYVDLNYSLMGFASAYPATAIIDENGVILYKQLGTMSYEQLKAHIEEALSDN